MAPNWKPKQAILSTPRHLLLHTQKSSIQCSYLPGRHCYTCCSYEFARKVFEETPSSDVVSATSIITSFSRRRCHHDAIKLFSLMLSLNIRPNQYTFGTTLYSSTAIRDIYAGKQLHACATKMGFRSDVFVGSSLLDHYAKLGSIDEARRAFEDTGKPNVVSFTALISGYLKKQRFDDALSLFWSMPERNVVSWNAMVGGCSQMGLNEESVNLFVEMSREGVRPNESTFPCVLSAAANMAALGMGRSFHASSIKCLSKVDVFVGNSLISFYAKCACLEDSVRVFDRLQERNIVSWNAVICGYAQNGKGEETLELYKRMRLSGLKPNGVTLLGLLFGCNHAGLVDEGYGCFKLATMEEPDIVKAEHYACVVDLLSRAGRFSEAERFLRELPFDPGVGFWKALLGGCQIHSNKELAEAIAVRIRELDPKDISSYVQLSNVYSAAGRWQSVSMIRREMKEKGLQRIPGCSWIESLPYSCYTIIRSSYQPLHTLQFGQSRKGSFKFRCYTIAGDGVGGAEFLQGSSLKGKDNGSILGGIDGSSMSFRTLNAEITEETVDFFVSDAEGDPDRPSEGFSSIDQAIKALRQGKFVIAVDDENGDNEGDLIMAATLANPKAIAFLIRHGSGIVSVGMKEEDLERLKIPMMSPINEIEELSAAASTVTVDAREGVSTGVSAADRAKTILALSSIDSKPGDFRRPGHVFPLKYRNGGVLKRTGHTEASVDLVTLAGLCPVSVLSTVIDPEDGSMARLPALKKMAQEYGLPIIPITDLIRYRRKREKLVEKVAVSRLPTKWGLFQVFCYRSKLDGTEHIAVVKGDIGDGQDILARVHSECLTGDILGSARCDCGNQLALAMQLIEQAGRGVLVYLRGHEGRGIGLGEKLRAYNLQDKGHDTVEANLELGLAVDAREYGIGAQILRDIGVRSMRLMTNNPAKFVGLKGYGLAVVGRVPVISPITEENKRYLETKRTKMGHVYGSDLPGNLSEFINPDDEKL